MVLNMSFKKEDASGEERWGAGKKAEKKGREDERERERKEGREGGKEEGGRR